MKKLGLLILLITLCGAASAQSNPPLQLREVDGVPSKTNATQLVFPNGTLSISGGVVTVTISGSGTVTNTGILTNGNFIRGNGGGDVGDSGVAVSNVPLLDAANVFTTTNQFPSIGIASGEGSARRLVNISAAGIDMGALGGDAFGFHVDLSGGGGTAGEHLIGLDVAAIASIAMPNTGSPIGVNVRTTVNAGIVSDQQQNFSGSAQVSGTANSVWGTYDQVATVGLGTISLNAVAAFHDIVSAGGAINNPTLFEGRIRKLGAGTIVGTATGIKLIGWSGAPVTSYGIYADASIDIGTTSYFIKSLSNSPSELSGDFTTFGFLKAGTTPTTLTNAAGKVLINALAVTGTPDGTKFLRDDGSWQAVGGGGSGQPAGVSTELQARLNGTTFQALTGSSISGANLTLGGWLAGLQDRGGQVFNVKAYGATGDGTTDDLAALVAANAAAAAVKGIVYLPAGTYGISAHWTPSAGVTIQGAGRKASSLKALAGFDGSIAEGSMVQWTSADGVTIRDLGFLSNSQTTQGFLITNSVDSSVIGCWFDSGLQRMGGLSGTSLRNITIQNNVSDGSVLAENMFIEDGSYCLVIGNTFKQPSIPNTGGPHNGIELALNPGATGVRGTRIIGNMFINQGAAGVGLGGDIGTVVQGNTFDGCVIAIRTDLWQGVGTLDATISGNAIRGSSASTNGILLLPSALNVTISNNTIIDLSGAGAGHGIYTQGSGHSVVGNTVSGNVGTAFVIASDYTAVQGNTAINNARGLYVLGDHNTLVGNTATDTRGTKIQDYGLVFASGADANIYGGNQLLGNLSGEISDSGSMNAFKTLTIVGGSTGNSTLTLRGDASPSATTSNVVLAPGDDVNKVLIGTSSEDSFSSRLLIKQRSGGFNVVNVQDSAGNNRFNVNASLGIDLLAVPGTSGNTTPNPGLFNFYRNYWDGFVTVAEPFTLRFVGASAAAGNAAFQILDDTGTVVFAAGGTARLGGVGVGPVLGGFPHGSVAQLAVQSNNTTNPSFGIIKQTAQTSDLFRVYDTDGSTVKAKIDASFNFFVSGILSAGSGPTTLTDSVGKILSASLNTVGFAQGGTGLTALGSALQQIRVNAGATALEYFTPSAGGVAWGAITGTLSAQTDLQAALDAKLALAGGTMSGNLLFNGVSSGSATFPALSTFTGNTTQYESVSQSAGVITHAALGSATNIEIIATGKGTGGLRALAAGATSVALQAQTTTSSATDVLRLLNHVGTTIFAFNVNNGLGTITAPDFAISGGYGKFSGGVSDLAGSSPYITFAATIQTNNRSAAQVGLTVKGFASQSAKLQEWQDSSANVLASVGPTGAGAFGVRDAGTTTVTNGLTIGHQSTGTPAAGLGSGVLFNINSSTTPDRNAGQYAVLWTDATDATRSADHVFYNVLSGAALAETFRIKANGTAVHNGPSRLKGYTVATLPAGIVGDTAYVTDLLTPTFFALAVGGGSTIGPVFFNGTNWVTY